MERGGEGGHAPGRLGDDRRRRGQGGEGFVRAVGGAGGVHRRGPEMINGVGQQPRHGRRNGSRQGAVDRGGSGSQGGAIGAGRAVLEGDGGGLVVGVDRAVEGGAAGRDASGRLGGHRGDDGAGGERDLPAIGGTGGVGGIGADEIRRIGGEAGQGGGECARRRGGSRVSEAVGEGGRAGGVPADAVSGGGRRSQVGDGAVAGRSCGGDGA